MKSLFSRFSTSFLEDFNQPFAVSVFCKAIVAYSVLRLVLVWPVVEIISQQPLFDYPTAFKAKYFFIPGLLAESSIQLFMGLCVLVWSAALWVRWNYVSAFLFFWLNLNLYRIDHPIVNGADIVVVMLSVWMMGMARWPLFQNVKGLQVILSNTCVLFAKFQVAFMYLISGWDKLITPSWRSGQAFEYIRHIDLFNPAFSGVLSQESIQVALSWATIAFELAFPVGVWFERSRLLFLILGVAFHLAIAFMLNLPDFGLVMILSYLVFLKDSDFTRMKNLFTLKQPQP